MDTESILFIVVLVMFIVCVIITTIMYIRLRKGSRTIIYEIRELDKSVDVILDDFWNDPKYDTLEIKKKA